MLVTTDTARSQAIAADWETGRKNNPKIRPHTNATSLENKGVSDT